jgi:hypothetical protein
MAPARGPPALHAQPVLFVERGLCSAQHPVVVGHPDLALRPVAPDGHHGGLHCAGGPGRVFRDSTGEGLGRRTIDLSDLAAVVRRTVAHVRPGPGGTAAAGTVFISNGLGPGGRGLRGSVMGAANSIAALVPPSLPPALSSAVSLSSPDRRRISHRNRLRDLADLGLFADREPGPPDADSGHSPRSGLCAAQRNSLDLALVSVGIVLFPRALPGRSRVRVDLVLRFRAHARPQGGDAASQCLRSVLSRSARPGRRSVVAGSGTCGPQPPRPTNGIARPAHDLVVGLLIPEPVGAGSRLPGSFHRAPRCSAVAGRLGWPVLFRLRLASRSQSCFVGSLGRHRALRRDRTAHRRFVLAALAGLAAVAGGDRAGH